VWAVFSADADDESQFLRPVYSADDKMIHSTWWTLSGRKLFVGSVDCVRCRRGLLWAMVSFVGGEFRRGITNCQTGDIAHAVIAEYRREGTDNAQRLEADAHGGRRVLS
jgi:hypothetical protein